MNLPYSDEIDVAHLSRIFDNKSECYKLFWFQAIVQKVNAGKTVLTYEELINEMIADAWYMVTEYHLNLGPKDNLEAIVRRLAEISHMKSSEKKENVLDFIKECKDRKVLQLKRNLTLNVPYRLQAPFMESMKGKEWNLSQKELTNRINQEQKLMYYFLEYNGLSTEIKMEDRWTDYICRNYEIILGWIEFHMVTYLQKRNPDVPGIIDKLSAPRERKLERVKKYWNLVVSDRTIYDIYGDCPLNSKNISIDHFVPWSYVAHDEFWNLHPTTRSINSSKNNHLAEWDRYFDKLGNIEYFSYQLIWKYPQIHEEFEKCAREHLHNQEIKQKLYRKDLSRNEFIGRLEEILLPVYQSAQNVGFSEWHWEK